MGSHFSRFVKRLVTVLDSMVVTEDTGEELPLDEGFGRAVRMLGSPNELGGSVLAIGNGGSAAIAAHLQADLSVRGKLRALVFHEAPMLTALANDFGYDAALARMLDLWARPEDCLVAISSSGASLNVLNAVHAAKARGCPVLTMSGFSTDNRLRGLGSVNFHVASTVYGEVELAHQTLAHALSDATLERALAPHVLSSGNARRASAWGESLVGPSESGSE